MNCSGRRCGWLLSSAWLFLAAGSLTAADPQKKEQGLKEKEERFQKMLSGATLIGRYTVIGKDGAQAKDDRYQLEKVSKVGGDIWLFTARIQYGDNDVRLPLPVPVKWSGDTPMIVLDDFPVPGFGKFSARVVFHDGKYAGTWGDANHGGHMFGRIEKPSAKEKKAEKKAGKKSGK